MPCLTILMVKEDVMTEANKKRVDGIVTEMLIDIKDAVDNDNNDIE